MHWLCSQDHNLYQCTIWQCAVSLCAIKHAYIPLHCLCSQCHISVLSVTVCFQLVCYSASMYLCTVCAVRINISVHYLTMCLNQLVCYLTSMYLCTVCAISSIWFGNMNLHLTGRVVVYIRALTGGEGGWGTVRGGSFRSKSLGCPRTTSTGWTAKIK